VFRLTVAAGVVNRFLGDPVKMNGGKVLESRWRAFDAESTFDTH
jgi:hypothetical protein